jgi:hypothetical protein
VLGYILGDFFHKLIWSPCSAWPNEIKAWRLKEKENNEAVKVGKSCCLLRPHLIFIHGSKQYVGLGSVSNRERKKEKEKKRK